MNDMVMDTAYNINSWFGRLATAVHRGFVCTGRARAAAELARLGYYEEARKIMLEDQEDS